MAFDLDKTMKAIRKRTGGKVSLILTGMGYVAVAFRDPHDQRISREAASQLQQEKRGSVAIYELPERIEKIQNTPIANGTGATIEEAFENLALTLQHAGVA